jgi:hypothetical protein
MGFLKLDPVVATWLWKLVGLLTEVVGDGKADVWTATTRNRELRDQPLRWPGSIKSLNDRVPRC